MNRYRANFTCRLRKEPTLTSKYFSFLSLEFNIQPKKTAQPLNSTHSTCKL